MKKVSDDKNKEKNKEKSEMVGSFINQKKPK
jgi:hypothetical protein